MSFFKQQKNNKGFTLVETMVAIFILTIALTSLINLTARSMFAARYARNEITVNYLLQEVADYIRNERDSIAFHKNLLPEGGWGNFLDQFGADPISTCFLANGCYFDVNTDSLAINPCEDTSSFGSLKCEDFSYDQDAQGGAFYNYTSEVKSNFKRKIFMKSNPANEDELYVIVTVEWLNGNKVRNRDLKFSLLKWFDNN